MIGRFYGPGVRKIAAVLVILAEIVWFALLTQATETVVTAVTPWNSTLVLISTAALFVVYTLFGGQRAVVRTDLFQFGLMLVAIPGIAFPLALHALFQNGLPKSLLYFPTGPSFSALDVLALLVLVGLPHAVGSDVWAKLLSARDESAARRGALGAAVSKLLFGLATATIALAGVSMHLGGTAALFPRTVFALAGHALSPLLLVALIATMQSSSDSVLLSAAGAALHDLVPGSRASSTGGRRLLVLLFGVLGLVVALAMRDLVETFRLGYTLFASGLILPTLVAFSSRFRVHRHFAGAAMLAGGSAALIERFFRPFGIDPVLVGVACNALVLLAGLRRQRNPAIRSAAETTAAR